jgi:hypothetical protein
MSQQQNLPIVLISTSELLGLIQEAIRNELEHKTSNDIKEERNHSEDKLLSRSEAAEHLRISLSTLNTYTKRGIVKGRRISGRVLYSKCELLESVRSIKTFKP